MSRKHQKPVVKLADLTAALEKVFGIVPDIESDDFGNIVISTGYMDDPNDDSLLIPFVREDD